MSLILLKQKCKPTVSLKKSMKYYLCVRSLNVLLWFFLTAFCSQWHHKNERKTLRNDEEEKTVQ